MGTLDDPTMSAQFLAAFDTTTGNTNQDATALEMFTATTEVMTLSACSLYGRFHGRPSRPGTAGMASIKASNAIESWRFAPVILKASGTPPRSTMMCRLLPDFPRSVGLGPVSCPLSWRHSPRQCWLDSSRSGHIGAIGSTAPSASDPRRLAPASRVDAASRSCHCRSPVLAGEPPMESPWSERTGCCSALLSRPAEDVRSCAKLARLAAVAATIPRASG